MKTIFLIAVFLAIPFSVYAVESFDITIHWTCENTGCLIEQRDWAALYLDYQDEIYNPETGTTDPNPVSKKQTIINKLVEILQQMVIAGAAKEADSYRITAVTSATTETEGIIGE